MVTAVLALTYDSAKNIAIAVIAAFIVFAVISAKIAASGTKKIIGVVIFAALAIGVWSQRQSLQDCASKVRAEGGSGDATCRFFGNDIVISSPLPSVPGS
ncbi:MAG: hypothetical protein JWM34_605 [Ilumatobacteraceae bacterium]|nr:hypothetical protein [Ilumatobacteraceae bacterium]